MLSLALAVPVVAVAFFTTSPAAFVATGRGTSSTGSAGAPEALFGATSSINFHARAALARLCGGGARFFDGRRASQNGQAAGAPVAVAAVVVAIAWGRATTSRCRRPLNAPTRRHAVVADGAAADAAAVAAAEEGEGIEDGPSAKTIETMWKFSNQYARVTGTYFCSDASVPAVVVIGLAHHKETLGAPLCPCRHYDDKEAEVKQGYWNCPCVPMRERRECHCMLFLEDNNPFSSENQTLDLEEILKMKTG